IVVTDVNVPCIGNMVQGEPTHQLGNSCSNSNSCYLYIYPLSPDHTAPTTVIRKNIMVGRESKALPIVRFCLLCRVSPLCFGSCTVSFRQPCVRVRPLAAEAGMRLASASL